MKVIVYWQQKKNKKKKTTIIFTCLVCVARGIVTLKHPVLPGWNSACVEGAKQAMVDWTRSNTHLETSVQSDPWCNISQTHCNNKTYVSRMWGSKNVCVSWDYTKKNCLLHNAFRCVLCSGEMWWPGLWCRLLLGELLYGDDLQVWTEARPTTQHSAPSGDSA